MKKLPKFFLLSAAVGTVAAFALSHGLVSLRAQAPGVNSPWQPVWSIPIDSIKRTYSRSVAALSAAAPATDILQICGGAGVVTRVTMVAVSGKATAVAPADITLTKRSTANTGGTAFPGLNGLTGIPLDASISTGVSTVTAWTANPTVGTIVGHIATLQHNLSNLTTGVGTPPVVWQANRPASAIVLRGTAQCLSVNLSSQSFAANAWDITVEWTEE